MDEILIRKLAANWKIRAIRVDKFVGDELFYQRVFTDLDVFLRTYQGDPHTKRVLMEALSDKIRGFIYDTIGIDRKGNCQIIVWENWQK